MNEKLNNTQSKEKDNMNKTNRSITSKTSKLNKSTTNLNQTNLKTHKPTVYMGGETVNIIRQNKVQFYEEDLCDIKPEKHR